MVAHSQTFSDLRQAFNGFIASLTLPAKIKPPLGYNKHQAARVIFLGKFRTPRERTYAQGDTRWREALGGSPWQIIKSFYKRGHLEVADLPAKLGLQYTVAQLKDLLRERDLPVSGRKAELIARLIEADQQYPIPGDTQVAPRGRHPK